MSSKWSFRGKYNTLALKLGTHCASYFYFNFGRYKKIIEFPAYHKTQVLGSGRKVIGKYKNGKIKYKNMTKPQRKKWSIIKAQEIMTIRGENKSKLFLKGKKDDLADTITQLMAFIYLHFIEKKQF